MFVFPSEVENITGYEADQPLCERASYVIEAFIGRTSDEMMDNDWRDWELVKRAAAFQAAYMKNNPNIAYEQAAVASTGTGQMITTFKSGDFTAPWIAPLAVLACRKLSWMRSRSVSTAPIQRYAKLREWETD